MKIAVYSGSFNPLHIGHQAIMEYLTREKGFDWVYLVVSPQSPFKDASNNLTARDRYLAAIDAVRRHPELHVWVDDIELSMEPPQYTIRTLDALKKREPENDFSLVIGADNLASFRGWRESGRILREYGVVVFPREGYDIRELKESLINDQEGASYRIHLMEDAPLVNISSSEIRSALAEGRDMSEWLM